MSYVPKYILKRMFTKDSVKLVGDNVEITAVNVITPIPVGQLPGNLIDVFVAKVDDEIIIDAEHKDVADKVKIFWNDEEYNFDSLKDAEGGVLPVGGKLKVVIPNVIGLKAGEKHKFEIIINIDTPIEIAFEREVKQ